MWTDAFVLLFAGMAAVVSVVMCADENVLRGWEYEVRELDACGQCM
jgi:hypothetical protein